MAFGLGNRVFIRPSGEYDLGQEAQRVGGYVRLPWITPIERLFKAPPEIHEPSLWEKERAVEEIGPILFIRRSRLYLAKNVPGKRKEIFHTKKVTQLWPEPVYAATMAAGRVYFTIDRIGVQAGTLIGEKLVDVKKAAGLQGSDTVFFSEHGFLWDSFRTGIWHRLWMSAVSLGGKIVLTCLERLRQPTSFDWQQEFLPVWQQENLVGILFIQQYPNQGALVRYKSADGVSFDFDWRAVDHDVYGYASTGQNPDFPYNVGFIYQLLYPASGEPLLVPYNMRLSDAGQAVRVSGIEREDQFSSFKARKSPFACMIMSGRGVVLKTSDGGGTWRQKGFFTIRDPDTGRAVTDECQIMPVDRG